MRTESEAFQAAVKCAKEKHHGVGIWGSPLNFTGVKAELVEDGWMVSANELTPKGKPQGLTLRIQKNGSCSQVPME